MKKLKFVIIKGVIYPRGEKPVDCSMQKIMATTHEIQRSLEQVKKEGYPFEHCKGGEVIKQNEDSSNLRLKIETGEKISSQDYECGFCGHKSFEYAGRLGYLTELRLVVCLNCEKTIRLSVEEIRDFFGIATEEIISNTFKELPKLITDTVLDKEIEGILEESQEGQKKPLFLCV